ncbi:MAG: helix-turn-helix transcriptional regulator [Gammaproteobacteria bacterium]
MSTPDWTQIAAELNAHLARQRLSAQDLARRAGVDRKTIERLRAGRAVRAQTLGWIEQALGIRLGGSVAASADGSIASAALGGYQRASVAPFVGEYLAVRRSFDTPGRLIASALELRWDAARPALVFAEEQHNRGAAGRVFNYHFQGEVSIPPNLGVMHFTVRSDDGRVRLTTTGMPREEDGTLVMKGFLLTLNELRDIGYYPVTSPVFFARRHAGLTLASGIVEPHSAAHAWADARLVEIATRFLPHAP